MVSRLFRPCYDGPVHPFVGVCDDRYRVYVVDRRDVGSWMSGPGLPSAGPEARGARLGLPPAGSGSVAGFGRRFAALVIDWFASILLVRVLFPGAAYGSVESSFATLGVFYLEVVVFVWLIAASFGQRVLGLAVVRVDGGRLGLGGALLRTLLLCLVVPAVVVDRDGRGLHDRAVGSVVVRR